MAKKRRHKRAVGKKRRRIAGGPRSSNAPTIGSRRRRRHVMKGRGRKRRRMGAPGSDGVGEYLGLVLGTGVGLTAAELITPTLSGQTSPLLTSGIKAATSIATFAMAKKFMKDNSFVKGVSIGVAGSAINDGLRYLRTQGMMSGPSDRVMEVKVLNPSHKRQIMPPMNGPKDTANVIGMDNMMQDDDWFEAHVVNG